MLPALEALQRETQKIYGADSARHEVSSAPLGWQHRPLGGRYRIDKLLGVGGNGSVYRAYDLHRKQWVALKVVHPSAQGVRQDRASLAKEVRLSQKIEHRNVARTFDFEEKEGVQFMTMELIEGESLYCMIRPGHPLPPIAHVIAVGIGICQGLAAIHGAGVVHLDLKPDNILLTQSGRVVITDFGIAREISQPAPVAPRMDTVSIPCGTPEYISPEQLEEEPVLDGRADLYALGIILYELLTGSLPFIGTTPFSTSMARLIKTPVDPQKARSAISAELSEIVLRCLSRHREDRFASAEDVIRALRALRDFRATKR